MILARYLDIRYFNGQTVDLKPATLADWRNYRKMMLGISSILWLGIELLYLIMKK
ncbi:MAG: hypothetical protein JW774_12945 [Candidatus Aureabacteria bacterium]|nr:hypothetical protein [Candidatus Auribacterota bacterium]